MSDPSPAEIMRRLDEVATRLNDTVKRIDEFRNWAERLYVPRMEWVEARKTLNERIDNVAEDVVELKTDGRTAAGFRRQMLLAVSVAAFSAIVSVAIATIGLILGSPPS